MEGWQWDAEVDGVVFNGRLNGVCLEYCVLGVFVFSERSGRVKGEVVSDDLTYYRENTTCMLEHSGLVEGVVSDVRPHLAAMFWYNSKSEMLIVELQPDIFAK